MREEKYTDDEREIFDLARLFCGYFAILYDLHRTGIHTEYGEELKTKLVVLELIYAISIHLQRLFATLASKLQALLHATVRRGQRHRNVSIYALEIIYRGMKRCGTLNWGLSENHVSHPMKRIYSCLKSRSEYLLSRIAGIECRLEVCSAWEIRTYKNPTLQFFRKDIKLPAALVIAPKRHSSLPWVVEMRPLSQNGWPVRTLVDTLLCHRSLDPDVGVGHFKQGTWTGDIYQRRRYSDVDSAEIGAYVAMLSIQSKSKCPKAFREAPAVASSIREPRNASVANTANCDLTSTEALDDLPHYPLFSDAGDEHRLDCDTDLGFEHSSIWLPSTPSLTQGQSNATWSNVRSLSPIDAQQTRLERGDLPVHALLTQENVSKVPGYSRKRQVDSDTSSSSSYKSAQATLRGPRKRAKTEADSDSAASGRQAKPKWSFLRSARALLSMLSTLRE